MEPAWLPTLVRLTGTSNKTDRACPFCFFTLGGAANRDAV
jgi:hypothetical protein